MKNLRLRLRPAVRQELTPRELEALTDYAVSTRYPGDYEAISVQEARDVVRIAGRIGKRVRALLVIPPSKPVKLRIKS
jgi:hypothetical protein